MDAVEKAVRALGKAMQSDPRYLAFQAAKQANDADTALQEMIQELNLKRMAYQHEMEKPEESRNSEKLEGYEKRVQQLYTQIMETPSMAAYDQAKQAMDAMMQQIDAIIMLCVNGEDPETCHPNLENCTGNCASCGGCH